VANLKFSSIILTNKHRETPPIFNHRGSGFFNATGLGPPRACGLFFCVRLPVRLRRLLVATEEACRETARGEGAWGPSVDLGVGR